MPVRLPERSAKPRETGLTHVLDRGLSLAQVDGLMEVAGASVDLVKLGWGTALVSQNLEAKLARYAEHGVPVVLGGTLTEAAIRQGRVDELAAYVERLGLIRRFAADGLTVLSEVGSKDDERIMAPYRWVEQIEAELDAGAWKVIAEARESGTAGIYRADGEVRMGLIDEIAHRVDVRRVLFEAPRKEQQVWFLRRFGSECNLGNIAPDEVLSLETLRLGLRADTLEDFSPA